MAITLDKLLAAYKQRIVMAKTNSVTTVAGQPYTLNDRAGFPVSTAALAAPTTNPSALTSDATTGFPTIEDPQGSNHLYLSKVEIAAPVAMSVWLLDLLVWAGPTTIPTSGTTTVTFTNGPLLSSRLPLMADGTTPNYGDVLCFAYPSTAGSAHAHTIQVTYTDQADNVNQDSTAVSTNGIPVNRLLSLPQLAGDYYKRVTGYKVNGVTSATGAMNIMVARSLGRYRTMGGVSAIFGPDYTGLPELFGGTALLLVVMADSTSSSTPYVTVEIAHMDPSA